MIKFVGKYLPQGDLNIFLCDEIPENAVIQAGDKTHVLAHSETGHNHVISSEYVDLYEQKDNEFIGYLDVKKEADVIHLRSFDTHETVRLPPNKYKITRQREYTAEGFRRAQD